MRPGQSPFTALARTIFPISDFAIDNELKTVDFLREVLQQEIEKLDRQINQFDESGQQDEEFKRLDRDREKLEGFVCEWTSNPKKIFAYRFEELDALCQQEEQKKQLREVCLDCINRFSKSLNSEEFVKIVEEWSRNHPDIKLLLVIDQFEELITLSRDEEPDKKSNKQPEWQQFLKFLEEVIAANLKQLRIVVTLRSDFEPRFLNSDVLKSQWAKARFPVRAMRADELRQAIERPAAEMALYFEPPNLVDRLIEEVAQMPGALPLLSFTLSEFYIKLYEKWVKDGSSDRALRIDADFEKEGGVAGSLTRRANQEYNELPDDAHRDTMRRVMLRMVTLEGGEPVRRRVPLSELNYANKQQPTQLDEKENQRVKVVLESLDKARLVVSGQERGEPYVEPAHDFLVKGWGKLQKWLEEKHQDLLLQRRLTPAAEEWKRSVEEWQKQVKSKKQPLSFLEKTESFLDGLDRGLYLAERLIGKEMTKLVRRWWQTPDTQEKPKNKPGQFLWNANPYLDVLNEQIESSYNWFNGLEAEFVQKSVWQKRQNISWRWRIAITVILGLSALTLVALIGQRNAQIGEVRASRASAEANFRIHEKLNALVHSLRSSKNIKQIFLPGNDLQNQVGQTLRNMFYGSTTESERWEAPPGNVFSMFFTSGRQLIVITSESNKVRLWNKYGKLVAESPGQKGLLPGGIGVSPDGSKIATATQDGTLRLWDLKGNKLTEFQAHPGARDGIPAIEYIRFSPDGNTIATTGKDNAVSLWDLQGKKIKGRKLSTSIIGLGVKPSGELLIATLEKDRIKVLDLSGKNSQELAAFENTYGTSQIEVSFSPNAKQAMIFYGEESENASLWNFSESREPENCVGRRISRGGSFSPDGNQLAATGVDGTVNLLDVNGEVQNQFKLPEGRVKRSTFSRDGKQIATLGDDNNIRLWDLEKQPLSKSKLIQNRVESISFSSNGRIATADSEGVVRLLDLQGKQIEEFTGLPKATSVSFSPNGRRIATTGDGGMVRLLNLQGKVEKEFQAHPQKVESVSWSQDSKKIGTIGDGGTEPIDGSKDKSSARLWDTQGNWLDKDENRLTSEFQSIGFQPDGKPIAFTKGVTNQAVDNIDKSDFSGPSTNLIPGREAGNGFDFVKISQDNTLLLTTSGNTMSFWNLKGEKLMQFSSDKQIKSLSLSPDNSMLAVIGEDGTTELWWLGEIDELLSKGCDRVRDYLQNNPDVSESDRHLCDGIRNSHS